VHHLEYLDILAILLGVMWTIAKLDAQGRRAENFPHVAPADFERWRRWTTSIYRLGLSLCFARVVFHQLWVFYVARQPMTGRVFTDAGGTQQALPVSLVIPPLLLDVVMLLGIAATFLRASRARKLRRELGIVLAPLTPQQAAALAPDEDGAKKN
jgi:hypothetical protein